MNSQLLELCGVSKRFYKRADFAQRAIAKMRGRANGDEVVQAVDRVALPYIVSSKNHCQAKIGPLSCGNERCGVYTGPARRSGT